MKVSPGPAWGAEDSAGGPVPARRGCRGAWRVAALLLRLLCAALLVGMFSLKVRDFLQEPVATSVREEAAPLPDITVCPSALNDSAMWENVDLMLAFMAGNVSMDVLLDVSELDLSQALTNCETRDGRSCLPTGEHGEFGWGRWKRARYPPGITCYTLQTQLMPAGNSEVMLSLKLHHEIASYGQGVYKLFAHGHGTRAKTYYGGGMVSAYFIVWESNDVELVLSLSQTVMVNRKPSPCNADADYDLNQCLQDCRSRAAFLAANCSVDWGSPRDVDVPPCASFYEYEGLKDAWKYVDPVCDCPQSCLLQEVTLLSRRSLVMQSGSIAELQLRYPYRKHVLEERRTYLLVDLLTDLGGTCGLLLGYSLASLVDVADWLVRALETRRRPVALPTA